MKRRLGLIVNPIAGMGGRVGLKGTDTRSIVEQARALGAVPEAPRRAAAALKIIADKAELVTAANDMGETLVREAGLAPQVVGSACGGITSREDTLEAAATMREMGIPLILFAGGDGTARDIHSAVGSNAVVLGIPAGVKMQSAVFAATPRAAAELVIGYLDGRLEVRDVEVMDIDEEAFRAGAISAKLYGYLRIPYRRDLVSGAKSGNSKADVVSLKGLAADVAERMDPRRLYIVGPGTTTRAVLAELGQAKTLLGIDLVRGRQILASDVSEDDILKASEHQHAAIIVTPIGGQGYLFGRGNQQISPSVIYRVGPDNIMVVATPEKLAALDGAALRVDTGDPELDSALAGYMRVIAGYRHEIVHRVVA